jgi:hypothetical protein
LNTVDRFSKINYKPFHEYRLTKINYKALHEYRLTKINYTYTIA